MLMYISKFVSKSFMDYIFCKITLALYIKYFINISCEFIWSSFIEDFFFYGSKDNFLFAVLGF